MSRNGMKTLTEALSRICGRISTAPSVYISRLSSPRVDIASLTEESSIRRLRLDQFRQKHPQDVDPIVYSRFVNALYPVVNNMGRFSPDQPTERLVNHSELLDAYSHLPRPGVAYIQAQDFEKFMSVILSRRDFVRPNALSPSSKHYYLAEQIIQAFASGQKARKVHLANFWKIARDLNTANVPVTGNEQRQLLYMTLYKESPDILKMVTEAYLNLNKALDTYDKYADMFISANSSEYSASTLSQFRELFKNEWDIETLNMFLFTAFRHDDDATFKSLLPELKTLEPNRKTFDIMLEKYAISRDIGLFSSWLKVLSTDYPHLVDIKTANTIIKALVQLDLVDDARRLVAVFSKDLSHPLNSEELFLKQLTIQDRETYNNYWETYEDSGSTENFSLYPTENTFLPLLALYCKDPTLDFETILGILYQAEHVWGIPITTRMYKLLFRSFVDGRHSRENLRFITGKLVASHDACYSNNEAWIKTQILSIELPPNVVGVFNLFIEHDILALVPSQGYFIKLSDELILVIYMAFDHCLQNQPEEQKLASKAHKEYQKRLIDARDEYQRSVEPGPTLVDLNARDEFMYIKKGFIIDLLDILS